LFNFPAKQPMDCNYYFLTSTAKQIWFSNDTQAEGIMFECLSSTHKKSFFNKVVFKGGTIPEYKLSDFADEAFLLTWEQISAKGKEGRFSIDDVEYTWFFFRAFKFNYLKQLEKAIKLQKAEKGYGNSMPLTSDIKDKSFSWRTQTVLNKLSAGCRELVTWKFIENLSHDEISQLRNIERTTSIKLVSRCGKKFLEIWEMLDNK
jgi:hypothetical protein